MSEFDNNKSRLLFWIVLVLFMFSLVLIVVGLLVKNSVEPKVSIEEKTSEIVETDGAPNLYDYFNDAKFFTNGSQLKELNFLRTDPFYEKCKNEGETFGTRCYY